MTVLSYDLHLHPGPSSAPRWGDGERMYAAAVAAGVRGFVWKSHDEHTVDRCKALPDAPVRTFASASLNSWATFESVVAAVEAGALWVWGTTMTDQAEIGWDLELPDWWPRLADWLAERDAPLVLATGHLGPAGRRAFAELAQRSAHLCSITHSLYITPEEVPELVALGAAFEVDCFTYANPLAGRPRQDPAVMIPEVVDAGALVYCVSDGGQVATGNPFEFAPRVLGTLEPLLGAELMRKLTVDGPEAVVAHVGADGEPA